MLNEKRNKENYPNNMSLPKKKQKKKNYPKNMLLKKKKKNKKTEWVANCALNPSRRQMTL